MFNLTCSVTKNLNITGSPMVVWIGPDNETITTDRSGITVDSQSGSGDISTAILSFNPLSVNHTGNYTCFSTLGTATRSYTYSLSVDGEL